MMMARRHNEGGGGSFRRKTAMIGHRLHVLYTSQICTTKKKQQNNPGASGEVIGHPCRWLLTMPMVVCGRSKRVNLVPSECILFIS